MSAALAQRPPTRQQALLPAPRVSRRRRRHGEKALDPVKSRGFVVAADYEAFGRAYEYVPRSPDPPAIEINLRFPGQYLDRETGLHYNWHRYYSPELGRYLTEDPLVSRGIVDTSGTGSGLESVYAYVANDPLGWTDTKGLCREHWTLVSSGFEFFDRSREGQETQVVERARCMALAADFRVLYMDVYVRDKRVVRVNFIKDHPCEFWCDGSETRVIYGLEEFVESTEWSRQFLWCVTGFPT